MTVIQCTEPEGCGCDAPDPRSPLIGLDEALRRLSDHATPIAGTATLPLSQATGRILTGPVCALARMPPFDNAAMDGYAVDTAAFSGDGPWEFSVVARVPAGASPAATVAGPAAARIFTGAPVPDGADAVVRQEDVSRTDDEVRFVRRPPRGLNIRRAGEEMQCGEVVVAAGTRLGPREIAACAAAGVGSVQVRRVLRVGLLVTGSEVRAAGAGRRDAEIWDVNTPMLCAAMRGPHLDLIRVEQVTDSRDALECSLARMTGDVDLVVTTGGVSVGEEDHVKPALAALGAQIHFSGVAIKPGKPVSFGSVGRTHWLGLPGNPLSAFVTWQIFGTALVRRLTGQGPCRALRRHVVTAEAIRRTPGRCELRPASLAGFDSAGREVVAFEESTHSGRVGRLHDADGLMFLPAEADDLPAGALVEFQPFRDC